MSKRHFLLAIPLAAFADFLVLVWMANRAVIHDAPDDLWSKISSMLLMEAAIGFIMCFLLIVGSIKLVKLVTA